jgi:hypothetical protein
MKLHKSLFLLLLSILTVIPFISHSQLKVASSNGSIKIDGTSTMHDWTMNSEQGKAEAIMTLANEKLVGVVSLSFSAGAETLKSTKGLLMDKIAYKSLKVTSFPTISFVLTSATVTPVDATTYQFKGIGQMMISGKKRTTDLIATIKYNPLEKSFTSHGVKSIKMSDYDVEAPSFAFGTVKTGDEIQIHFSIKLK